MQGALDALGAEITVTRLEPFVAPDLCLATPAARSRRSERTSSPRPRSLERGAPVSASSSLTTAFVFVWLGMVLAISFLETPLKFRAPGVTMQIGLGIGRLVFRALNVVEPCSQRYSWSRSWCLPLPHASWSALPWP